MRHIALVSFAEGPCNGTIDMVQRRAEPQPFRLPILGAPAQEPVTSEWLCQRCGQRWQREPLPQEAL